MKNAKNAPRPRVRYLKITENRVGQRLDNYLFVHLKGVPKSRIYRILRKGEIRLNGGRARPDTRLAAGDVVRIPPVRTAMPTGRPKHDDGFAWLDEYILYEDGHLMAVDKPTGLAVHGGSRVSKGLIETLRGRRPHAEMLELVHRLDRDTSGCLLVAKSRPALLALHGMLREGSIEKRYLALIKGEWRGKGRHVSVPLKKGRLRSGERVVEVVQTGKEAKSRFIPRKRYAMATLVEIQLLTGRTHQARAHAAYLGYPIAGDGKYGDCGFNRRMRERGLKRLFLHALSLDFKHPVNGCKMHIEAPLPSDLAVFLERLTDAQGCASVARDRESGATATCRKPGTTDET